MALLARKNKELQKRYGAGFPAPSEFTNGDAWLKWIDGKRKAQEPVMRDKRLHWSRHRHFRVGHQWISTRDGRLWREPSADVNDIRIVDNHIGPALDFRLGILAEQRPGFRHMPLTGGVESKETAEAQQAVAEYYFYLLRAWNLFLDAGYHAQTDGVSFIQVFVDQRAGPSRENVELVPETDERYANLITQGYEVDKDGNVMLPMQGEEVLDPEQAPEVLFEGDIGARVLLAHEVIIDEEARSVNGPIDRARWAIIRRIRSTESARIEANDSSLEPEQLLQSDADVLDSPTDRAEFQRGLPPFPGKRTRMREGIYEHIVFITPDANTPELAEGMWLRLIGNKIVEQGDTLPGGLIPLARVTDGSADPEMFPRPIMSDWIPDQIAINAFESLLVKHARWFAGGRMLALKNTLLEETYSNIVGSLVEYNGQKPDVLQPVSAGSDAWQLLQLMIKKLEDKTGHNDIARGRVSGTGSLQDVSGRALLGARELFERTFAPVVRATAEGATEWAHLVVCYAKYLFDKPRLIPIVGRGDLAKRIDAKQLGDKPLVYVDPETMMPLPRAMRHQMLFEMYQQQLITLEDYQKRAPYAEIRNVHMGETDQWDRAQWINTVLQERWEELAAMSPIDIYLSENTPVLWQDNPTVHKMALLEIILDERKPWGLRRLAMDRHGIYDQLERVKVNPMMPIPYEVIGVPPDLLAMQLPPVDPTTGQPVPGMVPGGMPEGMGLTNPTMTGAGAPPPMETAMPLGEFGATEENLA